MAPSEQRGLTADEAAVLALLAAMWGASFLFIKVGVREIGPLAVVASRLVLAVATLAGWLVIRRGRGGVRALWRRVRIGDAIFLGVTGSALPFLLIAWAETRVTSSLAGMLNSTAPLFTALFALLIGDAQLSYRSVGIVIGFAGTTLVAGGDIGGSPLAIAALLLATPLYATSALFAGRRFGRFEAVEVSLVQSTVGALAILPFAVFVDPPHAWPSLQVTLLMLGLGAGNTAVAYVLYYRLLASAGAQHAIAVTYLVPVTAVIYGRLVLDETIAVAAFVGMLVIIGGELITALPSRRPAEVTGSVPH
jgi:drug/metabolite transporter (DMT)-like permease